MEFVCSAHLGCLRGGGTLHQPHKGLFLGAVSCAYVSEGGAQTMPLAVPFLPLSPQGTGRGVYGQFYLKTRKWVRLQTLEERCTSVEAMVFGVVSNVVSEVRHTVLCSPLVQCIAVLSSNSATMRSALPLHDSATLGCILFVGQWTTNRLFQICTLRVPCHLP